MNFKGKVAMVTGAAVGIGRATALKLAEGGASLVLVDLDTDKLALVYDEVSRLGVDAQMYVADVGDFQKIKAITADAEEKIGQIDILVNNAAIWRCSSSFLDASVDEWEKYLHVNIMGVVHCTKAVLQGMVDRGYGRIINVASVAGVYGNANMVHYSATKGALISMTKALAKEVTEKGVWVNAVSPGSVSPSTNFDVNYHQPSSLSFIGRTGTAAENASLICYLASDEAGYISGQNIQIDGCRKKM